MTAPFIPSFLTKPRAPPVLAVSERRREQVEQLKAMRAPVEMPAPVVDLYRLRSQVAQLSDADFRALVVTEANARNMTGLWRELP